MSETDAVPLPREGEVFFDVRGEARSMRLSWYADSRIAVFSIWQGSRCTGTFRLPFADLARMVETLQSGPQPHARPEPGYSASAGYQGAASDDRGPAYADRGRAYAASSYDAPSYAAPSYDSGPLRNTGPTYDTGPMYDSEPMYDSDPGYDSGPGYAGDPGYAGSGYSGHPDRSDSSGVPGDTARHGTGSHPIPYDREQAYRTGDYESPGYRQVPRPDRSMPTGSSIYTTSLRPADGAHARYSGPGPDPDDPMSDTSTLGLRSVRARGQAADPGQGDELAADWGAATAAYRVP